MAASSPAGGLSGTASLSTLSGIHGQDGLRLLAAAAGFGTAARQRPAVLAV